MLFLRNLASSGGTEPVGSDTGNAIDDRRFVGSIVTLALMLRLFYLGHQSLWVDEILTVIAATPKPEHSIWTLLLYNIHGPLHALVVYLFRFVSESDFWMRLPGALAGTASVWFLYAWVREILGRRYARIAAVLLALSPVHIRYSQELRNYAFVFVFALAASYLLELLLRRWTPRRALVYGVCVAAAALSNFSAAFIFVVHTVIWFVRGRMDRVNISRWIAVCVIILVLVSPWLYRIHTFVDVTDLVTPVRPGTIETEDRLRGTTTFAPEALPYTFYTFSVGFSFGPSLRELHGDSAVRSALARHAAAIAWVSLLFGSVAMLGCARMWKNRQRWVDILLYITIPLLATFALNWQNAKAFNVRYVLLSLPAWLTVLSVGLVALRGKWRWVGVGAVGVTTLFSLWNYYFDGRYAKEDVRSAVRYIEEQSETYDCIFAPTVWQIVEHYARDDKPVEHLFRRSWLPMDRVDAQLDDLFAACNTFWYIRAREWVDDPDGYTLDAVRARCRQTELIEFDGVTLFRFARKNDEREGG